MSAIDVSMEPMLDMFMFETTTLLEQLDSIILEAEKIKTFSNESVAEIFRIMHTIKGSSAMMGLDAIASLAHSVEDMFFILREDNSKLEQSGDVIFDIVLRCSDYFKNEVDSITGVGYEANGAGELKDEILHQIAVMKNEAKTAIDNKATATKNASTEENVTIKTTNDAVPTNSGEQGQWIKVIFEDGCQMENIRAFMLIQSISECCEKIESIPANPEKDSSTADEIVKNGLSIYFEPASVSGEISELLNNSINIKSYEFIKGVTKETQSKVEEVKATAQTSTTEVLNIAEETKTTQQQAIPNVDPNAGANNVKAPGKQSLISVNQTKLDQLMDIVSELVIAESMVASNPDLKGLVLDNFNKSIRQLRKLTDELQEITMSMRMVTMTLLFQKMNRIVRDMSKKLDKKVELVTIGDETEVDKTINDLIQDPFMHMIRNAVDHAIETPAERIAKGKKETGYVTLSAQNVGGDIVIGIADDGKGLDPQQILVKARAKNLLTKPDSEYSLKEIHQMILLPGFSTNLEVTEFSGRGVGMDVVKKNIEKAGGSLSIESQLGVGTTFYIKIPLTLAIVDGLEFVVGDTIFTLPITSISQSFKLSTDTKVFYDTDNTEMIMLRNECFPIIRLHEKFNMESKCTNLEDGIMILIEAQDKKACIFVDDLIGEQQIVVKPFPKFLSRYNIKGSGLSGCTILGDGSISLILDANGLLERE